MSGNNRILERQLLMAQLISQQISPTEIVERVAAETNVSVRTCWATWNTRGEWLPVLVQAKELGPAMDGLLNDTRELRKFAMNLYVTARGNPSAQAGAIRQGLEAVKTEFDLRTKLGQLKAVPETQILEVRSGIDIGEALAKYGPALVESAMAASAGLESGDDGKSSSAQPVDT